MSPTSQNVQNGTSVIHDYQGESHIKSICSAPFLLFLFKLSSTMQQPLVTSYRDL